MRTPSYRRHSTRDIGFVEMNGKRHYLPGSYGSPESREAYHRLIAEARRESRRREPSGWKPNRREPTVADVCLAFLDHAAVHYPQTGTVGEYQNCRIVVERLIRHSGMMPARRFGPARLKAFRSTLVEAGQSRRYVNASMNRVRRAFKWGTSEELVPADVWRSLQAVDGLRQGRTEAHDPPSREPVSWSQVAPILEHLSPDVARAVELQWLTGVRPQSVLEAAADQFELDNAVWLPVHKMRYRGGTLIVPLGPRSLEIVREQIAQAAPGGFLFSPIRACLRPNVRYGLKYTANTYRQAIQRAQKKAGVSPGWTPHQLRHGRATEVRQRFGIEAAQAVLGHATLDATQIYSSRLSELARMVARETG